MERLPGGAATGVARGRRAAAVAALAALAVAAAGCAGSGSASSGGNGSQPPTSGTATGGAGVPTSAAVPRRCPRARAVGRALGRQVSPPVPTPQPYGLTCTYQSGAVPVTIHYQLDSAASFAAAEQAVLAATRVPGLGKAAFVDGGFVDVFTGAITIKVTSPLSTPEQVERLARKLV